MDYLNENFQQLNKLFDNRGSFIKIYDSDELIKLENITEVFFTNSKKETIRGMHYQRPPYEINRVVTCLKGSVLDVIVNINPESPDFKTVNHKILRENESLLIPQDYAHGFYAIEDCDLLYLTDNLYSKEYEDGILWKSINFEWPINNPILSERDKSFKDIEEL